MSMKKSLSDLLTKAKSACHFVKTLLEFVKNFRSYCEVLCSLAAKSEVQTKILRLHQLTLDELVKFNTRLLSEAKKTQVIDIEDSVKIPPGDLN